MRADSHLLPAIVALLFAAPPLYVYAQNGDCPPKPVLLVPADPVYSDAMELKRTLESHGFVMRCVFPSKLGSIFEVEEGGVSRSTIEGETTFRTNYGDVDAVFMPKSQTFANFKITEHRDGGGFLYTFGGSPAVWKANKFGSAHRIYFLDHENRLLFANEALLPHLEQTLQVRHRKL